MSEDPAQPIQTIRRLTDAAREGRSGARARPTERQRRWLARGLTEPGGKLPLFDTEGREIGRKTVESCLARGWAAPWFDNPIQPDWLVCRLTAAGWRVLGATPPADVDRDG